MAADHGHHEYTAGGAHAHHILPQKTIFLIFGLLLGGMALTIWAAFFLPVKSLLENTFFMQSLALGIAVFKAYLVVTYFMGVKMGTRLVKIFAIGGFVWFFVLFVMMADYVSRPMEPVVGWEKVPSSALPRDTVKNPE
ncbi:MAG: hypothetical protein KF824_08085 [Fimbriimonadaceae bacterium]|nr:MAG: hypothetical protein KF824_08085 [Fimbriimonadaceae bacterium]